MLKAIEYQFGENDNAKAGTTCHD